MVKCVPENPGNKAVLICLMQPSSANTHVPTHRRPEWAGSDMVCGSRALCDYGIAVFLQQMPSFSNTPSALPGY